MPLIHHIAAASLLLAALHTAPAQTLQELPELAEIFKANGVVGTFVLPRSCNRDHAGFECSARERAVHACVHF